MDKAEKLAQTAERAGRVRRHQTNPDVVALAVERVRRFVDVCFWLSIFGGLAFTAANVQAFAAGGAPVVVVGVVVGLAGRPDPVAAPDRRPDR